MSYKFTKLKLNVRFFKFFFSHAALTFKSNKHYRSAVGRVLSGANFPFTLSCNEVHVFIEVRLWCLMYTDLHS